MNDDVQLLDPVDYIIVGGGSAGAVLANRLTEDRNVTVLLVEAGGDRGGIVSSMPAGVFKLLGNPEIDWQYAMEPDPTIGGRSITMPSGKALGGSSAINGLVYIRGTRGDYDAWQQLGATGWGWSDVFPYFLRAETFEGPPSQQHGAHGPLSVSPGRTVHPLANAFIKAGEQTGFRHLDDYCGGDQLGIFRVHSTMRRGRRSSTARAYLDPARKRDNLRILTGVTVARVVIEKGRAVGIRGHRDGVALEARARREVILSAGAIGSPALLQRSGIGPGADLRAAGVEVIRESGQVGANLQEHPVANVSKFVNVPTYNVVARPLPLLKSVLQYALAQRGPLSSAAIQAMAFGKSRPELDEPDFMLSFMPLCIDLSGDVPRLHNRQGVSVGCNVCRPSSRGTVRIVSPDPARAPRIELPFLQKERDLEVLIAGLKAAEKLFRAPALQSVVNGDNKPDPVPSTHEEWADYVRSRLGASYHPVGTCRMGIDDEAPTDPQLRVRGVDGLRVVDASVMPQLVSGNTNAAAIMIGEKGADIIRGTLRG